MTISQEVQDLVAKVRNNSTLVASVDAGIAALRLQISNQQAQINALPVGGSLSADDKAALIQSGNELDATAVQLQNDIPANVPVPAAAPPSAAPVSDTHEADAAAASAATPLAGTGTSPAPDAPAAS